MDRGPASAGVQKGEREDNMNSTYYNLSDNFLFAEILSKMSILTETKKKEFAILAKSLEFDLSEPMCRDFAPKSNEPEQAFHDLA